MKQTIRTTILRLDEASDKTGVTYKKEIATKEFLDSFIGKAVTSRNFPSPVEESSVIGTITKAWVIENEIRVEIELFYDEYCLEMTGEMSEDHVVKEAEVIQISICDKKRK